MRRIDLTGKQFGEWKVLEYLGNKKYLCECSCKNKQEVHAYKLTSGQSKSCGHNKNQFIDLKDQVFGEWTVLNYAGDHKWNCRCSCGKEKQVASIYLRNGRSKSCGHDTTGFKDIKDLTFGKWTAIEYIGHTLWKCRCSCGKIQNVKLYDLLQGRTKSCGHDTTGFIDIANQKFGMLTANKYLNNGYWICTCDCGNLAVIKSQKLRNNLTTHCGCQKLIRSQQTSLERYGVKSSAQRHRSIENIRITSSKEQFEYFLNSLGYKPTPYELSNLIDLQPSRTMVLIRQFELDDYIDLHKAVSKYENIISEIFPCNNQSNRSVLGRKEIDLYYENIKFGIEFNGSYWHSEIYKDKLYHQKKSLLAISKDVRLFHIFEHEWLDDSLQSKIISSLRNIINEQEVTAIYARDCTIKHVDYTETKDFLEKYHLQNYATSSINLGIYKDNILIGIMTFGKPRFNDAYEYELVRLCYLPNIRVIGGTEKLFKYFLDKYSPDSIISYCDIAKFSGKVYETLGFKLDSITNPNYIWFNGNESGVLTRYQTQKHRLIEAGLGTEDQTEAEIMHNLGYVRIYDCGNYKFIWNKEEDNERRK